MAIARNVDISHVARIVDPWLPLQVVTALVLMASIIHVLLVDARLILTLVDRVLVASTAAVMKVRLAWVRVERIFTAAFSRRDELLLSVHLFELGDGVLRTVWTFTRDLVRIVSDGNLTHERIVVAAACPRRRVVRLLFIYCVCVAGLSTSHLRFLRLSNLHKVVLLKLIGFVVPDRVN